MPSLRNRLALAAAAITGVAAVQMKPDQICLQSIYEANNYLVFAGDDPVAIYMNACQNPLKVCSMYATGRTYCSEDEVESGAKYINETCLTYALAPILPIEQCTGEYDVGDAALNGLTRVEMGSLDVHEDLVVLSPTYFGLTHRTLVGS
jgi:ferric-chelate reductase